MRYIFLILGLLTFSACSIPKTHAKYSCLCNTMYAPVCGKNNKSYNNPCLANCEKTQVAYKGKCKPTSKPTSKPIVKKWVPVLPKKYVNRRTCMIQTVKWAKRVAEKVARYRHKDIYRKRYKNFKLQKFNGIPIGKLWLKWFRKHKNDKQIRVYHYLVYYAYRFITTAPPYDKVFLIRTIQGAGFFCQ